MKCILFFLLLLAANNLFAQDLIKWSLKRLTWNDFKEKPGYDKYPYKAAKTRWNFNVALDDTSFAVRDSNKIIVTVEAIFDCENSWVRTPSISYTSQKHLAHEQLHFDIVELYARRIRKQLSKMKLTKENYKEKLTKLFKKYMRKHNSYQEDFEYYTNGKREIWFEDWATKVQEEIISLDEFSQSYLILSLQ
jgi:Bacterial protein of unknown function (DUF922)